MPTFRILWLLSLCLYLSACHGSPQLQPERIEKEIHHLTNLMRTELGLEPLQALTELDQVARSHSQDMAERKYFDHIDPEGLGPEKRLLLQLPQLIAKNVGENIVLRSLEIRDSENMAKALLKMWRESPEHYQNLINPAYRQLGVGVSLTPERIYATQTFSNGIALLESDLPTEIQAGQSQILRFRYLSDAPRERLGALLYTPDSLARFPVGDGSYYSGKRPLPLVWLDDTHFELSLKAEPGDGFGQYQLRLGLGSDYFAQVLHFKTR